MNPALSEVHPTYFRMSPVETSGDGGRPQCQPES